MIERLKSEITKNKIRWYFGYQWLSGIGLGFLVADGVAKYWPFSLIPLPILLMMGFIGIWGFGYILHKSGVYDLEQSFMTKNNSALLKHLEEAKNKNDKGDSDEKTEGAVTTI